MQHVPQQSKLMAVICMPVISVLSSSFIRPIIMPPMLLIKIGCSSSSTTSCEISLPAKQHGRIHVARLCSPQSHSVPVPSIPDTLCDMLYMGAQGHKQMDA